MNSVHFSSASDDWATPQKTFDELNAEFGPFELDVCASPTNAKSPLYLDVCRNGLTTSWRTLTTYHGTFVERCWMNPPYGRTIGLWVKKAYEESQKGCTVCCLLPARTDTRWFHEYCAKASVVRFLKGRLKFGGLKNSAPFPSMVVVFHPEGS